MNYIISMQSVADKILARVYGHGRGWSFSKIDFLNDFADEEVRKALSTLTKKGVIRRVSRGIYDYPLVSSLLNTEISPDIHQVAKAYARRFKWRIQPSGNTALNYLGLSSQIPVNYLYSSDGPDREYHVGNISLQFKHTALKEAGFKYSESSLLVQALKTLGKENIDDRIVETIRIQLPLSQVSKILNDTRHVSAWILDVIKRIYSEDNGG
jgi:hypothetical protein